MPRPLPQPSRPWERTHAHSAAQNQHLQEWLQLQQGLQAPHQDAAAQERTAACLQQLLLARQSVTNISSEQAGFLHLALTRCISPAGVSQYTRHAHTEQMVASALLLLARWASQLTRAAGGGDASSRQQLQQVMQWLLQHAPQLPMRTPHAAAAALLFCGTAYPGCTAEQRPAVLSYARHILTAHSDASSSPMGPAANPMASLAASVDACTGCELLLVHTTMMPAAGVPAPSLLSHPTLQLLASILQATQHAASSPLMHAAAGGHLDLSIHLPQHLYHAPERARQQAPEPVRQQAPEPARQQAHDAAIAAVAVAGAGQYQQTPAGTLTSTIASYPSGVGHAVEAVGLTGNVACIIAMRTIACVAAMIERWAAGTVRSLTVPVTAQPASSLVQVLQTAAQQLQACCNQGLVTVHSMQQALQASALPSAHADVHSGSFVPGSTGSTSSVSSLWGRLAAGGGALLVFPSLREQRAQQRIQPGSTSAARGRMDTTSRVVLDTVLMCCGLLGSAGLVQGIAAGLRQVPEQQRAGIRSQLQAVLIMSAGAVQSTLAAVCKQAAASTEEEASHRTAPTVSTATSSNKVQYSLQQLLWWSAGYVQGHLVDALGPSGLQHLVAVPGPLAVHLPSMVSDALLGCVLSCDPLLLHALQGASPAHATAWLREQAAGDVMWARLPTLARAIIHAAQEAGQDNSNSSSSSSHTAATVYGSSQEAAGSSHGTAQAVTAASAQHPRYTLDAILLALQAHANHVASTYAAVVMHAPEGWLAAVDTTCVRDVLDRVYVVTCTPLASVYVSWPAASRQHAAVRMLRIAATLHFCAVQLPIVSQLIQRLIPQVLVSQDACMQLLAQLPCYEVLISPAKSATTRMQAEPALQAASLQSITHSSPQTGGQAALASSADQYATGSQASRMPHSLAGVSTQPRWLADPVLGAQLLYMLPIAAAAACHAADSITASQQLLPTLFLLLKHPQAPVSKVAHTSMATLLSHLGDQGHTQLVEQAMPYYIQRSLQTPWHTHQLEAMDAALPRLLNTLPVSSPTALYCMQYMAQCAVQWFQQHPGAEPLDFAPLYEPAPSNTQRIAPNTGAATGMLNTTMDLSASNSKCQPSVKLVSMTCSLLLLADWQLVPEVARLLEDVIHAAGQGPRDANGVGHQQARVLQYLHDMLIRSDDYVRKRLLMEWLQSLIGGLPASKVGATWPAWHKLKDVTSIAVGWRQARQQKSREQDGLPTESERQIGGGSMSIAADVPVVFQ